MTESVLSSREINSESWRKMLFDFIDEIAKQKTSSGGFGATTIEIQWKSGTPFEIRFSDSSTVRVKS